MKGLKIIVFIVLVLAFTGCNNSGNGTISTDVISNPKSASGSEKDNLPDIQFDRDIFDFGKVVQGEKVTYDFRFKNTGKSDLLISQVNTSCGCTVTQFPKTPIKPGDEGSIRVTFDSENRKGFQNKEITVVTNCQPSAKIVRIKAMVIVP